MKKNWKPFICWLSVIMLWVLVLGVQAANAYTASDYLVYNSSSIDWSQACSVYNISNPTASVSDFSSSLGISNYDVRVGSFISGSYSVLSKNVPYDSIEWIPNNVCVNYTDSKDANHTLLQNCTDKGKLVTTTLYRDEWIPVSSSSMAFNVGETKQVRFCGTFKRVKTGNGWEIAIDHIPSLKLGNTTFVYSNMTWWNTSWDYCRAVQINSTVNTTLTNFVATIVFDSATLVAAGKMNANMSDFRVLDSTNTTVLNYEIANNTNNTASTEIYTLISSLSPGGNTSNTSVTFCYGNPSATDAQNKSGTWLTAGYQGVFHLGDLYDSAQGKVFTNNGVPLTSGRFGITNTAYSFNGNNSILTVTYGFNTTKAGDRHVFVIYKPVWRVLAATAYEVVTKFTTSTKLEMICLSNISDASYCYGLMNTGGSGANPKSICNLTNADYVNTWQYQTYNWTASTLYGTNNASSMGSIAATGTGSYTAILALSQSGNAFNGTIDEVRISNVTRSMDWQLAESLQTSSIGEEDNQNINLSVSASPASPQFYNTSLVINFTANLTARGAQVSGAVCNLTFDGADINMVEGGAADYNYYKDLAIPFTVGNHTWNVTCIATGFYTNQSANQTYTILPVLNITSLTPAPASPSWTNITTLNFTLILNYTHNGTFATGATCNLTWNGTSMEMTEGVNEYTLNLTPGNWSWSSGEGTYPYNVTCNLTGAMNSTSPVSNFIFSNFTAGFGLLVQGNCTAGSQVNWSVSADGSGTGLVNYSLPTGYAGVNVSNSSGEYPNFTNSTTWVAFNSTNIGWNYTITYNTSAPVQLNWTLSGFNYTSNFTNPSIVNLINCHWTTNATGLPANYNATSPNPIDLAGGTTVVLNATKIIGLPLFGSSLTMLDESLTITMACIFLLLCFLATQSDTYAFQFLFLSFAGVFAFATIFFMQAVADYSAPASTADVVQTLFWPAWAVVVVFFILIFLELLQIGLSLLWSARKKD